MPTKFIHPNEETGVYFDNLIGTMHQSFLSGDSELFMSLFDIDIVNSYYTRKWFDGYAVIIERPVKVEINIDLLNRQSENELKAVLRVVLNYRKNTSETLLFEGTISVYRADDCMKFTQCEISLQQPKWEPENVKVDKVDFLKLINHMFQKKEESSVYLNPDYIDLLRSTEDPLDAGLYARVLIKSLRYRTSNIEVDSASLIADVMSERVIQFAYLIKEYKGIELLAYLKEWGGEYLIPKTYSDLRQLDKNYFPAKELSLNSLSTLDEVFYQIREKGYADVSCVEILSYYMSFLLLSGMNLKDAYIIVQPFHYLAAFELDKQSFIVSFNDVVPMTTKRLYGDTSVIRLYNHLKFYDCDSDMTNMTQDEIVYMKEFFNEKMPVFNMAQIREGSEGEEMEIPEIPPINTYKNPIEYSMQLKKKIYLLSKTYPDSIFTWAKYAYQTLFVQKPQAYILCGKNSMKLKEFSSQYSDINELLNWMKQHLGNQSIFLEADRVMTAEQVLLYRTGGLKDRAVFLFTVLRYNKLIEDGGIIVTDNMSYVVFEDRHTQNALIDMSEYLHHSWMDRNTLKFAFNDKSSYNAYFHSIERLAELEFVKET